MKYDSLGMIETAGLVASIVAFDKIMSSGKVEFYKKEVLPNGQVVIFFLGEHSNIEQVLESGEIAGNGVGRVIAKGFVPFPNNEIEKLLTDTKNKGKRNSRKNAKKNEDEKIETLFDALDELGTNDEEEKNNKNVLEEIVVEEEINSEIAAMNNTEANENNIPKYDSIAEVKKEVESGISETETENNQKLEEVISQSEEEIYKETELESEVSVVEVEEEKIEDIKAEEHEEIVPDENPQLTGMSHLDKLRAEAIAEAKSEKTEASNESEVSKENDEELEKMNVHELRKRARAAENFPIKGREISKANRGKLLEYFYSLKK